MFKHLFIRNNSQDINQKLWFGILVLLVSMLAGTTGILAQDQETIPIDHFDGWKSWSIY